MSQNHFQNYTRNALGRIQLQNSEPFYKPKTQYSELCINFQTAIRCIKVNFFDIAQGQADIQPECDFSCVCVCLCICGLCHFGHSLTGSRVKPGRSPRYVQNKSIQIQTQKTQKATRVREVKSTCVFMRVRAYMCISKVTPAAAAKLG